MRPQQTSKVTQWEDYPISLPDSAHCMEDVHYFSAELKEREASLFADDPASIKLQALAPNSGSPRENGDGLCEHCCGLPSPLIANRACRSLDCVRTCRLLGSELQPGCARSRKPSAFVRKPSLKVQQKHNGRRIMVITVFSFICQRNSCTRLKITAQMFQLLCHTYEVFPKFLTVVFKFGLKVTNTDEHPGAAYRHLREIEALCSGQQNPPPPRWGTVSSWCASVQCLTDGRGVL